MTAELSVPSDRQAAVRALDDHSRCIAAAADRRGLPWRIVVQAPRPGRTTVRLWLQLRVGGRDWFYRRGVLRHGRLQGGQVFWSHVNGRAAQLTTDKMRTKAVLAAAGLSTPRGGVFAPDQQDRALALLTEFGRPVCVKPNEGRKGILVFPGCATPAQAAAAFGRVAAAYPRILVEESVGGEVIRFYYVRPRVVGIKLSLPANVTGNGVHSIAALIEAKNVEREVRVIPGHKPIIVDEELCAYLAGQGLGPDSVPPPGRQVQMRALSNGATGADSIACPDTTHPSYGAIIQAACQALEDLSVAAIDMMIADRHVPAAPGNHWLLEVNSSPGVLPYHYPWAGEPQDVSGALVDMMMQGR